MSGQTESMIEYPKPVMSIAELVELGHSKTKLTEMARVKGFPGYKTSGNGKILYYTAYLDAFLINGG